VSFRVQATIAAVAIVPAQDERVLVSSKELESAKAAVTETGPKHPSRPP